MSAAPLCQRSGAYSLPDENTLKKLIMNTYTTILARGIKGCYVYACNPNMQKYLKEYIFPANDITMNNK